MPSPHDLDPPSMTEDEKRAKRRQDAAIAFELYFINRTNQYRKDED